jgi:D-glycero-alpha-D-manno-heptose 1-phosphate guanylyltransferase
MDMIVLAGGLGVRLRNRVPDVPKPLAPVQSRPFLDYLLDYLVRQGVQRVILSVGYKADAIERHIGAEFCGVQVLYAREHEPLGTGGAIRHALKLAASDPVGIVNGDTFVQVDLRKMVLEHRRMSAVLSIGVTAVDDASRYGSVEVESGIVRSFHSDGTEKGGLINAGVYLVPRDVFNGCDLSERFSFEKDFLAPRVREFLPHAFEIKGGFIDIGIPEDYERAQVLLPAWIHQRMPQHAK